MGYIFDPDELNEIVLSAVRKKSLDLESKFDFITKELKDRYPDHIDDGPRDWIFNNAGGAMGQLHLLHASLSEYVIFFGTPIGTEGHSGRYGASVYDFMIRGELVLYKEGNTERESYVPGKPYMVLHDGDVKGYRIPEDGWMLEYARGPIPAMLPFGLADTVFSTLDLRTFGRTFKRYGELVVKELRQGKI